MPNQQSTETAVPAGAVVDDGTRLWPAIGQQATDAAEDLRWSEDRLVAAMGEPQDWCDLLDAAVRVLRWPDNEDFRDALAGRVVEIIPDALP